MRILIHISKSIYYGFTSGCVVFVLGFIGPIILAPDANQGPLLGFILGPFAFLLGIAFYVVKINLKKDIDPWC